MTKRLLRLLVLAVSFLVTGASCAGTGSGGESVPLDYVRGRVEGYVLSSWLSSKPGDYVESLAIQGADKIVCRQTFEGMNPDGTVRVKTERSGTTAMEPSPFGGSEEVANFREGTEIVTVGGAQLVCTFLEGEGTKGRFKLWLSPAVPGAVVRMESPHGTLEVSSYKKTPE
ncbi:MAG: hypothetical protein RDV41_02510 [Planctomycetota bacterium]|nr:hypothetical protein [Planctomycetota bacterium]